MRRPLLLLAVSAPLAACAHAGATPAAEAPMVAQPPNGRARLYADCLAASAQAGTYDRYGRYLRLTCDGAPAEALFGAMEGFARARGHVSVVEGVETRGLTFTTVNDRCWRKNGHTACIVILPVGPFLDPSQDAIPAKDKPG